jgi:hypothetical protein
VSYYHGGSGSMDYLVNVHGNGVLVLGKGPIPACGVQSEVLWTLKRGTLDRKPYFSRLFQCWY